MSDSLKDRVAASFLPHPPEKLGLAVSGGSDSTGLLYLLHEIADDYSIDLSVVTVDHGFRVEAIREIAHVAARCAELDVNHTVLRWRDWDGQGNKQDAARRARYALMTDWAKARQIQTMALGHTSDDQAETVLMRLARGSGVDGLTAMVPRRIKNGVVWLRPLLGTGREELRDYLNQRGISWCDDPTNEDDRYDRIKARKALAILKPLGIDASSLGQVASNMSRARDALDWQAFLEARKMVKVRAGALAIDWRGYRTLPDEIARRLLVNALLWIGGAEYPPRRRSVAQAMDLLKNTPSATLEGCMLRRIDDTLWIFRELNAVAQHRTPISEPWDGRWEATGPDTDDDNLQMAPLGEEGILLCPFWRDEGLPRDLLTASPAIWSGATLVAAPLAGFAQGWSTTIAKGEDAFFAALLSH
ncbi:MAG: tRNA lysidine(34) synthetase TilS [Roseobacter sp.]